MLQQNRGHCRLVKRLLFGRRPFVRLALTLFCLLLLTVLALLVEFPSKWALTFNGHGSDGKFSSYANSDGLGDDGNGLAVPPKCCQCADGWRGHFVPAETEARVFQSVRREHIELLAKLNEAQAKMDAIEAKMGEKEAELAKLVLRVEELKLLQREYSDSRAVRVQLPHSPPKRGEHFEEDGEAAEWGGESPFDFSRCSIAIPSMPLFVFPPLSSSSINGTANSPVSSALADQFHRQFVSGQQIASITAIPANACLFVSIIDTVADDGGQMARADENGTKTTAKGEKHRIEGTLFRQHFAISGGKNHLVFDLHGHLGAVDRSLLGAAVVVTPRPAAHAAMRRSEQRLLPLHLNVPAPSVDRWRELPPLLPVMRKYFVCLVANPALLSRRQMDDLAQLKTSMDSSRDSHLIDLECPSSSSSASSADHLCYAAADDRLRMGRQSVFTVLLFPEMPSFQQLFYESLLTGSVPVLCSHRPAALPFARLIDWRLATVQIVADRFPELHFILRAIPLADLIELKRKGRFFFEHYLADTKVVVNAVLSAMRVLLQLPGMEQHEPQTVPLYRSSNSTDGISSSAAFPSFVSTFTKPPYDDEYLGPIEVEMMPF